MSKAVEIQSVMTLCPHSVGLDQELKIARELMRKYSVHHLPVQQGGRLVGVITDRDIKFAMGWSKDADDEFLIEDVYTPEPLVVEPEADLAQVLRKMVENQIGCTLVAVNKDKLVGIFTTTDACRVLADTIARV